MAFQAGQQPGSSSTNMLPKEDLAASGSGHLRLTDFDEDDKDEGEDAVYSNFLLEKAFLNRISRSVLPLVF